jgi:hypothetical protein
MARRSARFCLPNAVLLLLVMVLGCLVLAQQVRADAFDLYTNRVLTKLMDGKNVKQVKKLTRKDLLNHDRVLPGITYAFIVVKTNAGRNAKLLVQSAHQKIDAERSLPILVIHRYVCYKEGTERTIQARGQDVSLFGGFRFSLDLGQVVPKALGGDLRLVVDGDKTHLEPVGKAKLYLVTRALPNLTPKKGKFVMGPKFEARYFNGTFKLHDDGRRSGKLTLKVDKDGKVTGAYYSDKDGSRYEVKGKVGTPRHSIEFTIKFPRVEQRFKGMLFTGNGKAMAGTSRMDARESAFYALRLEK